MINEISINDENTKREPEIKVKTKQRMSFMSDACPHNRSVHVKSSEFTT